MTRRRSGLRAQDRTYKAITTELRQAAVRAHQAEFRREVVAALQCCHQEIAQFHHQAYPDCQGGCPGHAAMAAAAALLRQLGAPLEPETVHAH